MNTQVIQPHPPKRRGAFDALRPVVMAAALLVVLVLAALAAAWLTGPSGSGDHTLTVEKPTGGTLTGSGITCGTGGTSCSTSIKDGQVIELRAEADEGYSFAGFQLQCAPSGRLEMKADHRCGARFDRTSPAVQPTTSGPVIGDRRWPLTLTPPEHGTIVTLEGHECGPTKKACTVEVLEGTIVSLEVMTEPGHRVQSYTGACVDGTANMTQARTCGVVLVKGDGPSQVPSRPPSPVIADATPRPRAPEPKGGRTNRKAPEPTTGAASAPSGTNDKPSAPIIADPVRPEVPVDTATPIPPREGDRAAAEKLAQADIQRVLKSYRSAYERMDIPGMKRLQPGINVASHQLQFGDLKWVKYTFGGDPLIEDLDIERGTVRAIVDLKTENEQKSGKIQKPLEGKVTYLLKRIDEGKDWQIVAVKYEMKK